MSRIVALMVLGCALAGVAQARIEFYCTRASEFDAIADPHKFSSAEMDFLPYFNGVGGTPTTLMESTFGSETIYVWGRFVNEVPYTQIFGVHLEARTTGWLNPLTTSRVYRHRHPMPNGWDRWDGTVPLQLHAGGYNVAVAVVADGIEFRPPAEPNSDLYEPATGTFLYGALQLNAPLGSVGELRIGLGRLGLIARDEVHSNVPGWSYWPEVRLNGIVLQPEYWGPGAQPPTYEGVAIAVIPEPATLALLALAAAGLRRR